MTTHLTSDPFEPQPRHEDIHGARYWPDTMFIDMSAYPAEVQSFDGEVGALMESADLGILVAAAARMHEQAHWLQSIGSSFGRFLALNRVMTGDLADAILTTATPHDLDLLAQARREGRAPAARTRAGQLRHGLDYSTTLQSLFDHWWSTVAVDHILTTGTTTMAGPIDPRFMVGLSLRYAVAGDGLRDVFNAPDAGFIEATIGYGPVGDDRAPAIRSGLTVNHLEEAAAMVVQHMFNGRIAAALPEQRYVSYAQNALAWTLERFFDDRHSLYTKALTLYGEHAPDLDERRHLELFLLIVDIALNPLIADDGGPLGIGWHDFHPVLRFERLLAALDGFVPDDREIDGVPADSWWVEERAQLVARAGLSDAVGSHAFARTLPPPADPLRAPTSYLRRFIGQAAANLDTLRMRFPAAAASPLHVTDSDEPAFLAAIEASDGPGYDPPLVIKYDGEGQSGVLGERPYVEAVTAVSFRRSTHSWLVRPGALNFNGLPGDKTGRLLQQASINRLETLYGITV